MKKQKCQKGKFNQRTFHTFLLFLALILHDHVVLSISNCPNKTEEHPVLTSSLIRKIGWIGNITLGDHFDYDYIHDVARQSKKYEQYNVWSDIDDLATVLKHEGECYALFRGTDSSIPWDVGQNRYFLPKRIKGSNCYARGGAYSAFFTDYLEEFQQEVENCMDSCLDESGTRCELNLSGLSQGGQIAMVAAVYFRYLDPLVIVLGPSKTIFGPNSYVWNPLNLIRQNKCTDIDNVRILRITMLYLSIEKNGISYGPHYDDVPFELSLGARSYGDQIIVDSDGIGVYVGKDVINPQPRIGILHDKPYLTKWMQAFAAQECTHPTVNGFPDGHFCSHDVECIVGSSCVRNSCQQNQA